MELLLPILVMMATCFLEITLLENVMTVCGLAVLLFAVCIQNTSFVIGKETHAEVVIIMYSNINL